MKIINFILFPFLFSISTFAAPTWYPMPAEAYKFGQLYPKAQQLLFAFDYGHALVYERLLQNRGLITDPKEFEKKILDAVMKILKNPPTVKVDEDDIAPLYVYTFPLMVDTFDWSHMLHQFVLDVLATSKDRGPAMNRRVNELFIDYKKNKPLAITDVCKTMLFMDGQFFSKDFRRQYPSFNLLIWSYHWFQIKLYEALLKPTKAERDIAVDQVTNDFWTLISDLPDSADFDMMPETRKEAPNFYKAFPLISASFDNNHMLHDIVSDILASKKVPSSEMRKNGIDFARMAMDPEAFKSNNCGAE
ncbi:MAG: hypothetical protein H7328_10980 [Bdellovibrio sp.]|nr:hypothetical protein [Bdellovibrio sp.]